jgi:uncharacterized surface protein with fasciclin (FAS1) repeats
MKKLSNSLAFIVGSILAISYYGSCKKVQIVETTTTDVNIYEYLKQNPETYSELVKIVDKSGYAGFLNAYGSYTIFAPTNDGVKAYLTEIGKSSVDQLSETESKDIVKFHLMEDTLTTNSFKDGKLPLVTMYGQYLVTSVVNSGGSAAYNINRQAIVLKGNIHTGNGFIHSIDHVLKPATKSLAQQIADNPDYSIFKQAMVTTGFYDSLNTVNLTNPSRRWLTVLAETNKALLDSGITTYAQLAAKYSQTGNPLNPLDSLHIYVAYHIIPDARYLADIVSASSHTTLAPLEVLASKLDGEKVLINDIDFNGVHEIGIELDRAKSDFSATNGVLHSAKAHFAPKIREAVPLYWDVADFPEVRKLPAVFRKANFAFALGSIKDITWDKATNTVDYTYTTSSTIPVFWNDYLSVPMGATGVRTFWYEFTTPLLVKGKYKVWICYRTAKGSGTIGASGGSNCPVQVSYDGQVMSRPFNFCDQRPNLTDGELEALGWKKYSSTTQQVMTGKFVGIVDVQTTDRHKIRMDALPPSGTGNPSNFLDMIHFIPVAMNQYLPRFNRDGTLQNF